MNFFDLQARDVIALILAGAMGMILQRLTEPSPWVVVVIIVTVIVWALGVMWTE